MDKSLVNGTFWLLIVTFLSFKVYGDELRVVRANQAEQACYELSQEYLLEIGLSLSRWRVETVHHSRGFSVEGLWHSSNGRYWVECNIGFNSKVEHIELTISKE